MTVVRSLPATEQGYGLPWMFGRDALGFPLEANSGGPMSRTRREPILSTLLDNDESGVHCPRCLSLAIDFEDADPFESTMLLLRRQGFTDPEELRMRFTVIPGPMLCHLDNYVEPISVVSGDPEEVLRQAFLLGLCTAVFFDPARPVIWTRASLTRRLALYDTAGFYA